MVMVYFCILLSTMCILLLFEDGIRKMPLMIRNVVRFSITFVRILDNHTGLG